MKRILGAILIVSAVVAGSYVLFHRKPADHDQPGIRSALEKYLSNKRGLNLAGMDMEIKSVSRQGNQAEAQVEFRAKAGGPSLEMSYQLERQAEGWVVQSSRMQGGGHPGIGEGMPTAGELPPGHPMVPPSRDEQNAAPGMGQLPPGHPPINQPSNPPPQTTPQP